jgi:hypothetical protein
LVEVDRLLAAATTCKEEVCHCPTTPKTTNGGDKPINTTTRAHYTPMGVSLWLGWLQRTFLVRWHDLMRMRFFLRAGSGDDLLDLAVLVDVFSVFINGRVGP